MRRLFFAILAVMLCLGPGAVAQQLLPGDIGARVLGSEVRMTMITEEGHVSLEVGKDWRILAAQGKPPVASLAFLIENPADRSTQDSTNLSFLLIYPKDKRSKAVLDLIGKPYGQGKVGASSRNGWVIFREKADQGKTTYTVIDAKREIADVVVHMRLAWPLLDNNPAGYDRHMEATFNKLLGSVEGGTGPYRAHKNDVFQRPTN
jgi:hypothetical protein